MRIVCDNCGAKYSIADEKVAGKMLRIRCKACSHVINVDGRDVTKEDDAATAFGQPGSEIEWHVVIDGDQQGPFSEGQVKQMFGSGSLSLESYVWRDGFDGWKTIAEVPELQAEQAPAANKDKDEDRLPKQGGSAPVGAAATGIGASGVGTSSPAASGGGYFDSSGGRLGAAATSSSAASAGLGASGPQPLTGKRNENSVLFSLANLQALSAKPGSPASAPGSAAPRPGATTEGSGLIDIRALASTSGASGNAPGTDRSAAVDQLMSIGTGTPLASPLSPVLAAGHDDEEEHAGKKNKQLMVAIIVAGALVFLGMAALAAVIILKPDGGTNTAAVTQAPEKEAAPATTATTDNIADAPAEPAENERAEASEEPSKDDPAPPPAEQEPSTAKASASSGGNRAARPSRPTSPAPKSKSDSATASSTPAPKKSSGGSDIDSLLAQAAGGGTKAPQKSSGSSSDDSLPETPTAASVLNALKAVQGDVRACGNGQHGVAKTAIGVNGNTGRVTSAKVVSGPFVGTPVAGCIERAVRKASFPRFKRTSFSLDFPFTI